VNLAGNDHAAISHAFVKNGGISKRSELNEAHGAGAAVAPPTLRLSAKRGAPGRTRT
jgi:hypothetical protein